MYCMVCDNIYNTNPSNQFIYIRIPKNATSPCWKIFVIVFDKKTDKPQCAQCSKCKHFMSYIGSSSGNTHLNRHTCAAQSQPQPSITSMFKTTKCPLSVKSRLTDKAANMCGRDLKPFNTVAGDGFKQFAQESYKQTNKPPDL